MKNREYILTGPDGDRLKLPVNPAGYEETMSHDNRNFSTLEAGEIKAIGRTKLKKLKFSCFFPFQQYPFCTYKNFPSPTECISMIEKWRLQNRPVRVLITGTAVNTAYAIESFATRKEDGTEDIYYDLEFEEYRQLNVSQSGFNARISDVTGLRLRPVEIPAQAVNRKAQSYLTQTQKAKSGSTEYAKYCVNAVQTFTSQLVGALFHANPDAVSSAAPKKPQSGVVKGVGTVFNALSRIPRKVK